MHAASTETETIDIANPDATRACADDDRELLVKVENVSKKFCRSLKKSLWYGVRDITHELDPFSRIRSADPQPPDANTSSALRPDEFWAVNDVSFELQRGECLGLIGHNGAGKTTLLKMLNGLIKPDRGRMEIRGRVGALIALGAGFNPILTGRENIYINGAVVGLSKREIDTRIDDIIEFAGIGDFIDAPVQSYSSGMNVRLGFAVATAIKPDVFIIDEVLAVGDLSFVLKCLDRIDHLMESTAVVFVSHSMPMVSRICSHILHLDHGRMRYAGPDVSKGIDVYYQNSDRAPSVTYAKSPEYRMVSMTVNDVCSDAYPACVSWGEDLDVEIWLETPSQCTAISATLIVHDKEQKPTAVTDADNVLQIGEVTEFNDRKRIRCVVHIPAVPFAKGIYSITLALSHMRGSKPLLRVKNAIFFQMVSEKQVWAPIILDARWGRTPRATNR